MWALGQILVLAESFLYILVLAESDPYYDLEWYKSYPLPSIYLI